MKSLLTIIAILLFTVSAFAVESKVAYITSDVDKDTGVLSLEVVNGKIDSLRIVKVLGQQILEDESHPVERILAEGLVASEREGYKVVILRFESFNLEMGGTVVVDYLMNGVTGKRGSYKLKAVKEGESFVLKTAEGQKVNRLHFKSNKVLFKVVGIKSVEVSFK